MKVPTTATKHNTYPCRVCGKPTLAHFFGACEPCAQKAIEEAERAAKKEQGA